MRRVIRRTTVEFPTQWFGSKLSRWWEGGLIWRQSGHAFYLTRHCLVMCLRMRSVWEKTGTERLKHLCPTLVAPTLFQLQATFKLPEPNRSTYTKYILSILHIYSIIWCTCNSSDSLQCRHYHTWLYWTELYDLSTVITVTHLERCSGSCLRISSHLWGKWTVSRQLDTILSFSAIFQREISVGVCRNSPKVLLNISLLRNSDASLAGQRNTLITGHCDIKIFLPSHMEVASLWLLAWCNSFYTFFCCLNKLEG